MKILSLIFLAIGIACVIVMLVQVFQPGVRGDRLDWLTTGAPVIASFCLGSSLALFLIHRKQKRDKKVR